MNAKGIAIIAATVAASLAIVLGGLVALALFAAPSDRDRLDQAWSEASSEDRQAVCMGWMTFRDFTVSEMQAQTDMDRDVVEDFLSDTCGSAS